MVNQILKNGTVIKSEFKAGTEELRLIYEYHNKHYEVLISCEGARVRELRGFYD